MGFEVAVEEFSGPLDLLCRLVESGEIEASKIRVSDLIRTYTAYLLVEKSLPIRTVSEFISLTARLLLGKIRGLSPIPQGVAEPILELGEEDDDGLREALRRYRPFRNAASLLSHRLAERQKFVVRQVEEDPAVYDYGDLFTLARLWWELLEYRQNSLAEARFQPSDEMLGFESKEPDFLQVERRMSELENLLQANGSLVFQSLIPKGANRSAIVVTLLAILELSRLGQLKILQEARFSEIRFELP